MAEISHFSIIFEQLVTKEFALIRTFYCYSAE